MSYFQKLEDYLESHTDVARLYLRYNGKIATFYKGRTGRYIAKYNKDIFCSLSSLGAAWSRGWHTTRHHKEVEISKSLDPVWHQWDDFFVYTPPTVDWTAFIEDMVALDKSCFPKVMTAIRKRDPHHQFSQQEVDLLADSFATSLHVV